MIQFIQVKQDPEDRICYILPTVVVTDFTYSFSLIQTENVCKFVFMRRIIHVLELSSKLFAKQTHGWSLPPDTGGIPPFY